MAIERTEWLGELGLLNIILKLTWPYFDTIRLALVDIDESGSDFDRTVCSVSIATLQEQRQR